MSQNGEYPQGGGSSSNGDKANRQNFSQDSSWIRLEIYVKDNQLELLTGLDQWLKLNLISEAQVKKICRQNLCCTLPDIKPDIKKGTTRCRYSAK